MQTIRLLEKSEPSSGIFVLRFEKPEGFAFKAGQFARLGLTGVAKASQEMDGGEKTSPEPIFRAYSIASAPSAPYLDFFITCVPGGTLSPRLTALEPDDEALLDGGAEGNLLPERIPGGDTLWLFATGSGLSPFASILRDDAVWARTGDIIVVHSVRTHEEAAVTRTLLSGWPERHEPKILVTTTRETDPSRAGDFMGRIPALIASGELEAKTEHELTPESARVLLCGNPDFITATRAILKARGIVSPRFGKPGQLVVENFW